MAVAPGDNAKAPGDIWEVAGSLRVDEPLEGSEDPRWVDTTAARGSYQLHRLYRRLGASMPESGAGLRSAPNRGYFLFCGHRGCGKSTELRRIRNELDAPDLYCVVFADAAQELDVNNLRYQDILLHVAGKLVQRLQEDGIRVGGVHLAKLEDWFAERVATQEVTKEFAAEVKAGVEVAAGLPFVGKLLAEISNAFKTNSTHKEALRRVFRNHFTEFADAFNHLIASAEEAIAAANRGRRILFVVDGTDRLRDEDARAFFEFDVHQLQQIRSLFLYCAPIHLIYEGNAIGQNFDHIFKLPMVKVANADGSRNETGFAAMLDILHRRAAPSLFDAGVADSLVEQSGGHPRDLLRLLLGAFASAGDRFDEHSARVAVREAATEFRRILEAEDYELLAKVDSIVDTPPHSDRARKLLYNLALLEYNDFYCRSHPVIRTTSAYRQAAGNAS